MKFHHFGFRVKNMDETLVLFEANGGKRLSGKMVDPLWGVTVYFLSFCGLPVEFVEGSGRNHVCFESERMEEDIKRLGGILVRRPAPAVAFDGRNIAWVYTSGHRLVEIVSKT